MMGATMFDTRDFRRALGAFPTGVTVVTTREPDGTPRGFTANSFTSVSLEPPMVLVCIAKAAASRGVFEAAEGFAVTILKNTQKPISALFASKDADKFARVAWRSGAAGLPVIEGGAAWFSCARERAIDAGDHVILLGRVLDYGHAPEEPLGYCRGTYVDFALSQSAVSALGREIRVEAILERDDRVLLLRSLDGCLALPGGATLGPRSSPTSLYGFLETFGLRAQLDFLFAVFENPDMAAMRIVYRGTASGGIAGANVEPHPLTAIPFERVADPASRSMLARYVRERTDGFGVYVGTASEGVVHTIDEEAIA